MSDQIKDMAAKHWHAKISKPLGLLSFADVFQGDKYEMCFRMHEAAFLAGYRAGFRAAKKGKVKK